MVRSILLIWVAISRSLLKVYKDILDEIEVPGNNDSDLVDVTITSADEVNQMEQFLVLEDR
jgi:hypothetical protein